MEKFRLHGSSPFSIVVVHGGPGAAGEMAPMAKVLAEQYGILEPYQSGRSVREQIEELGTLILEKSTLPVILVGYSYGAWLSIYTAVKYPHLVRKLILIGCPPFESKYAAKVFDTRLSRMDMKCRSEFVNLLNGIEKREIADSRQAFHRVSELISISDSCNPISINEPDLFIDPDLFSLVWADANQMRKEGKLMQAVKRIQCPVIAIHGDYDPHPVEGFENTLREAINDFQLYLLKNCGHKPWIEKNARENLYNLLCDHFQELY